MSPAFLLPLPFHACVVLQRGFRELFDTHLPVVLHQFLVVDCFRPILRPDLFVDILLGRALLVGPGGDCLPHWLFLTAEAASQTGRNLLVQIGCGVQAVPPFIFLLPCTRPPWASYRRFIQPSVKRPKAFFLEKMLNRTVSGRSFPFWMAEAEPHVLAALLVLQRDVDDRSVERRAISRIKADFSGACCERTERRL